MDPTTNPTPMPTSNPAPAPEAPGASSAPNLSTPSTPEVSAPAAPISPAGPTPATAAGGMTTPPVNPIINPTGSGVIGGAPQVNGLAATDPITRPEPAPAPDPIEEELKAPMKAAAPAPGSIGSAVSGPGSESGVAESAANPATNPFMSGNGNTPSVAFNDPAAQPDPAALGAAPGNLPQGNNGKNNKTTLIILIVVVALIVVALVGVLVFQLIGSNGSSTSNIASDDSSVVADSGDAGDDGEGSGSGSGSKRAEIMNCTREMTADEISNENNVTSGSIDVSLEFDDKNTLTSVLMMTSVIPSDEAAGGEPMRKDIHEAEVTDLTAENAGTYSLPLDESGGVELSLDSIKKNYESLDFTCEVL